MKKLLILIMTVSMVLAFAACGQQDKAEQPEQTEGLTAIPVGGGIGDWELSGDAYGSYSKIDTLPEFVDNMQEGDQVDCYYDESCNTPYIAVFRFAKKGMSIEECADQISEECGSVNWEPLEYRGYSGIVYQAGITLSDENYYYIDCFLMEDGDDFVELDFLRKCEEIALGDSGKYMWVPAGYTDKMNDTERENGSIFYGEYDESYVMPVIWIGKATTNYDELCWYWSEVYEEMPVDEATYSSWVESEWSDESVDAYYKAFGITDVEYFDYDNNGIKAGIASGKYLEGEMDDMYCTINGVEYNIFLYTKLNPDPVYCNVMLDSIHSK